MSNWFVFYAQTGREQTACDFLNKLLSYLIEKNLTNLFLK